MITTFTAEGLSADQAFNQQASFIVDKNLTRDYVKANVSLEEYAQSYLGEEPVEGIGYYVTIRPAKAKPDTQEKTRFKVVNHINKTVRKWITMVNFVNDEGKVLETATTKVMPKAKAIARAKVLAEEKNCTITIVLSKEVVTGTGTIAEVQPKEIDYNGKYFFFGVELPKEEDDDTSN